MDPRPVHGNGPPPLTRRAVPELQDATRMRVPHQFASEAHAAGLPPPVSPGSANDANRPQYHVPASSTRRAHERGGMPEPWHAWPPTPIAHAWGSPMANLDRHAHAVGRDDRGFAVENGPARHGTHTTITTAAPWLGTDSTTARAIEMRPVTRAPSTVRGGPELAPIATPWQEEPNAVQRERHDLSNAMRGPPSVHVRPHPPPPPDPVPVDPRAIPYRDDRVNSDRTRGQQGTNPPAARRDPPPLSTRSPGHHGMRPTYHNQSLPPRSPWWTSYGPSPLTAPTPTWPDPTAPNGRIDRDRPWYGPPPPHDSYAAPGPAAFHASVPQWTMQHVPAPYGPAGWARSWPGHTGHAMWSPAGATSVMSPWSVDEQERARAVGEVVAWAAGDDALAPLGDSRAESAQARGPTRHHDVVSRRALGGNDHERQHHPPPPFAWFAPLRGPVTASPAAAEPRQQQPLPDASRATPIESSSKAMVAATSAADSGTRSRRASRSSDAARHDAHMDDEKNGGNPGSRLAAVASVPGRAPATSRDPLLVEVKGRQRRAQLPAHARAILFEWVGAHRENPYPTRTVKNEIMAKTGLTLAQLENWFVNYRYVVLAASTSMSL
ncbi:hypothetical protein GGF31_001558 [Allomyces arbusculus]|nr:hypothetical protein GGF31_001558 [Allomyces arbusculus]